MNPTAAFPVHTLTPDQAAEELALLLDEKFLVEDDPIAFHHWKEAKAQRVTDLQMWLLLHPVQADPPAAAVTGPETIQEDAPPQHLEPPPEPAPKKEKTVAVTNKLSPKEKLASQIKQYEAALAKVVENPSDRKLRQAVGFIKSHLRTHCAWYKLSLPHLEPLPPLPDPKPHTGLKKTDAKIAPVPKVVQEEAETPARRPEEAFDVAQAPKAYGKDHIEQLLDTVHEALARIEVKVDPAMPKDQIRFDLVGEEVGRIVNIGPEVEKAGPGPYIPPTAQDLRDLLTDEELAALGQVAPPKAVHGTIDLVEAPPDPLRLRASIRAIRRQFLGVLVDLEGLGSRERRLIDEDLQGLIHLVLTSEIMMGEPDIPQAG